MKVYINSKNFKETGERDLVEVALVRKFDTTLLVQLSDGNIILRKVNRDLPEDNQK